MAGLSSFTQTHRLRYLALIILLLSVTAHAQTMQGTVADALTGRPLIAVTIVNTSTQQVTTTNDNGLYTILAKEGDVIAFSFIGYRVAERRKPPAVIIANVNVQLEPTEYQLKEFQFRPRHLTQYQVDSIERVKTYRIQLQRMPPSPFVSPVSAIAEKFSKKAKRTYQFQKDFAAGEKDKFIDTRYTSTVVSRLTNLKDDSLGNFMNAFPMPYEFARVASDLEVQMWIRNNYKAWIKRYPVDTAATK
jgi:hypothetical protein